MQVEDNALISNMKYLYIMVIFSALVRVGSIIVESESCPDIFKYKKSNLGSWSGLLRVPLPDSGLPIHIQIEFSLRALLTSKYVGLIELAETPETVMQKIMENRLTNVEYDIRFPLPLPLPVIKSVKLNGLEICKGHEVSGSIVTYIKLEHEFPTNYHIINEEYIKSKYPTEMGCGEFVAPENIKLVPEEERWPWLVAILLKRGPDKLQFHCTGTLLSHVFVLTAHCFSNEMKLNYNSFVLYLGKHDLSKWGENESQIRKVKRVYIHPEFSPKTYNADLAIIELTQAVIYGLYVKPMCLWQEDETLENLVLKEGIIIGWSKDDVDHIKPTPRMVQLQVVNQEACLRSQVDFHYITSTKTFCAGTKTGKGPCNGDSGSAIIFWNSNKDHNYWHLRGIISLSLVNNDKNTCDFNQFIVFTDVSKYQPWLSRILNNLSITSYEP